MILAVGEVLAEIMRETRGVPLGVPGAFRGPFASGAPAIFAFAAARLGGRARFAGARGNDAFGELCAQKLAEAGVDTRALRVAPRRSTGIAFVSYETSGERAFLFHLPQSAAARVAPEHLNEAFFEGARWLHVTGSSLAVSASLRRAVYHAVERAKAAGATVSFDPNLRPELISRSKLLELSRPVLTRADYLLPSGAEAAHLAGLKDSHDACRALLQNAKAVILKRGARGCRVVTAESDVTVPSVAVDEVDPTGAGDCFAAALAVRLLEGAPLADAARFANVAGALATTVLGPMEGVPTREAVEAKLAAR